MSSNSQEVTDDLALKLAKANAAIEKTKIKEKLFQQARQDGHQGPIWGMSLMLDAHYGAIAKPDYRVSFSKVFIPLQLGLKK